MAKQRRKRQRQRQPSVNSLLDAMEDGNEYGSIVSLVPHKNIDLAGELVRALKEIEKIRQRPCLSYIGNVVSGKRDSGIDSTDDLPFHEMVEQVGPDHKSVDIILATNGGSAHQVSRFVNCLRSQFDEVDFLLPSFCMSAGTIFALSGDKIWMTSRACLGPIDPQVPSNDGRFVPAQALLLLVQSLQKDGEDALKNKKLVPWTAVQIINSLDKKELADAISATEYSVQMATQFLENYKFKSWVKHKRTKKSVSEKEKRQTAEKIALALASHSRWRNHGHGIPREVLWDEVELYIDHPDDELDKRLKRFWALSNWIFDKTSTLKFVLSKNYRYIRQQNLPAKA